jgi:O-antigen/teichoic acid export membrane protein
MSVEQAAAPAAGGPPKHLRQRVMHAGSWILGGYGLGQFLRLATNVVLARLLSPDVFGLMSVVYILMVGMQLFSDLGINRSVVQSPRGTHPDLLDTAWTIQVIRGVGLGALSVAIAGGFAAAAHLGWTVPATVYADPRLPWIVAAFSFVAVFAGFESIRIGVAKRGMQMRVLTQIDLASQISAAVVMVLTAWATHSIWALVLGAIVSGGVRCVLGHVVLPGHRERLRIVADASAELLGNGKWIFLASILGFAAVNGDRLLLGGLIDARSFGLYAVAFLLVNVLTMVTGTLCTNVAYPALAEVHRERGHDLGRTLQKFQWLCDGLVTFSAAILMTAGPTLIHILYDRRYRDAGWIMVVLAAGAVGMRYQVVEQAYQATGRPQYVTLANFLRLAGLGLGILVGQHFWGVPGAIAGIALSQYSAWPLAWWFKARHRVFGWRSEAMLAPALAAGAGLGWTFSQLAAWLLPARFLHP